MTRYFITYGQVNLRLVDPTRESIAKAFNLGRDFAIQEWDSEFQDYVNIPFEEIPLSESRKLRVVAESRLLECVNLHSSSDNFINIPTNATIASVSNSNDSVDLESNFVVPTSANSTVSGYNVPTSPSSALCNLNAPTSLSSTLGNFNASDAVVIPVELFLGSGESSARKALAPLFSLNAKSASAGDGMSLDTKPVLAKPQSNPMSKYRLTSKRLLDTNDSIDEIPDYVCENIRCAGSYMKKKYISILLDFLFQHIARRTMFPTSAVYRQTIDNIFQQFPEMQKPFQDVEDAKVMWVDRLSMRFRNVKRKAKAFEQFKLQRQKQKKVGFPWGMQCYQPPPYPGENDKSIALHKRWLKNESKKRRQDAEGIQQRMVHTFPDRRNMIVAENATPAKLKEEYPTLFSCNAIVQEMERLLDRPVATTFQEDTRLLMSRMKSVVRRSRNNDAKALADREVDSHLDVSLQLYKLVCSYFKENSVMLSENEVTRSKHPCVVSTEKRKELRFDGILIDLTNSDESECLLVLLSSFHVFNLPIIIENRCTISTLQKFLLNIEDSQPVPQNVKLLLKKIRMQPV